MVASMNPQPADIMLSGKRVHVWMGGNGPALLLLHSAWGDAELSWSRVWNDLAQAFTVIAPDLPGFGASDPLDKPTLHGNAVVLMDLLDNRKVDRAIIAGNSFSAAVAIAFASAFPGRTRRIVLVNGTNLPMVPGFIRKLVTIPALEKRFRGFMRDFSYSDKAFAKAFPDPSRLPPGYLDRIRKNEERQSRNVFDTFLNQTIPQMVPPVPATIVWGTGDRLVPGNQLEKLRKWLGSDAFIPIEGAGHLPQVERPGEFVEVMKRIGQE